MDNRDIEIIFHPNIDFADAARVLWTAVRLDLEPNELIDVVAGENLIVQSKNLEIEEKAMAFDFLAKTNSLRRDFAARAQVAEKDGPRDIFICWLVVSGVVFGELTKTEAIARAAAMYSKAKAHHRDNPTLSHQFKVANNRQIEAIWAKYKPVLHYAEVVAHDWIGEDIEPYPNLSKALDHSPEGPEEASEAILRVLREKGLVDTALIVKRDDQQPLNTRAPKKSFR